ncbi:MAG: MCE family protein [Elusimicrobiaceae bacterium]|nr:MCE family protein [Elusimicrobiaceae bacterium]MBP5616433.1 MCE family protein [Elusimicrobiaceae bacterium]
MKNEPNRKAIGLFLIVGFALFLGLIGHSILSKIHADTRNMVVMYFNESLQGLSEGSSIVFQGVEVGKVTRILLVTDKNNLKFKVAVYARLKQIGIMSEGSILDKFWKKDNLLGTLVGHGLRARIATQSYLTGQLMIELVMLPGTKAQIEYQKNDDFPQIPTVLSKREELARGLDALKVQEMMDRFNHVTEVLGKELPVLLPALTKSSQNLDQTLAKVAQSSDETISNLNETLHEVSDAAKSFQNLTDYLERHPESLLKGKKGE